jgi:hypothetical protein
MLAYLFVAIYVLLCTLVAIVGSGARLGFWGTFVVSLLLTPVLTILFLIVFTPKTRKSA